MQQQWGGQISDGELADVRNQIYEALATLDALLAQRRRAHLRLIPQEGSTHAPRVADRG